MLGFRVQYLVTRDMHTPALNTVKYRLILRTLSITNR